VEAFQGHLPRNRSPALLPDFFSRRCSLRFLALTTTVLLTVICADRVAPLVAQEDSDESVSREYRIKAAYLYQFGRYVEWPPDAFSTPSAPFVIGVLTESPIRRDLLQIAETKKIQDRAIEIRLCSVSSNLAVVHILFLPASLPPKSREEAVRKTTRKHVLLVGENETFLADGCGISFVIEDNKIRFYIARKTFERQGLSVSAKLLQVGHVTD
jgi:hypothetical protein